MIRICSVLLSVLISQPTLTAYAQSSGDSSASTQPASTQPPSTEPAPTQPGAPQGAEKPASTPVPTDIPASTPAVPSPPPALPVLPAGYVIGPDDSISVTVWKEPTLSGTFPVRPDGMISLALLGDIPAAGFTPMKLGADITERFKKFIQDPNVTVGVSAVNSKRVFMIGEIGHVGALSLTPGMTPLQAISAAGGLTPYANKKHIYILRGEVGKQQKIPWDYNKAVKDGNMQGLSLEPGDTIVVP